MRRRLDIDQSAQRLDRFLRASIELMKVIARACGHAQLREFDRDVSAQFTEVFAERVDLVLTGINLGLNIGHNIWHSGTVAAAVAHMLQTAGVEVE